MRFTSQPTLRLLSPNCTAFFLTVRALSRAEGGGERQGHPFPLGTAGRGGDMAPGSGGSER